MLEDKASGNVRLCATPDQFVDRDGSWQKGPWGLLVTSSEVIVGRKGMTGTKIAAQISILDFGSFGVGLQGGHGPLWEVQTVPQSGGRVSFLFDTAQSAEFVGEYINSGVAFAKNQ